MSIDAWLLSATCCLLRMQRQRLEARMTSAFDRGLSLRLDAIDECVRLLNVATLEEKPSCR